VLISLARLEARIIDLDVAKEHPLLAMIFPKMAVKMETENILTTLRGQGADESSPHLLLMAHTDTKSQNISIVARIISVVGGLVLTLILVVLFLVGAIWPEAYQGSLLRLLENTLLIVDIGFSLALLGLVVQNESPGALDNGASCVVLMQTAKVLAANPDLIRGLKVSFAFTGGEELGLAGSRALVRDLDDMLGTKERLLVLNLDGVGARGRALLTAESGLIPKGKNREMIELVSRAAQQAGADLKVLKVVVGGEADHIPFLNAGVQAVSLAHFSKDTLGVHTDQDTVDKVDAGKLAEAHEIILSVLTQLRPAAGRNND